MASSVLPAVIVPIVKGAAMCGPAFTVDTGPGDNLWIHRAIYLAPVGAILVVDLIRRVGRWQLARVVPRVLAIEGDPSVLDLDALAAAGQPRG